MKDLFGDTPWAERDAGMQQALDHAERKEPKWGSIAYDFLLGFAQKHHVFISEDVSDASKRAGFPQPPTDRAWGAVYTRAQNNGIIVKHGIGRSRRRHASICPLWRSKVFSNDD
jgi:hypothetical protein